MSGLTFFKMLDIPFAILKHPKRLVDFGNLKKVFSQKNLEGVVKIVFINMLLFLCL